MKIYCKNCCQKVINIVKGLFHCTTELLFLAFLGGFDSKMEINSIKQKHRLLAVNAIKQYTFSTFIAMGHCFMGVFLVIECNESKFGTIGINDTCFLDSSLELLKNRQVATVVRQHCLSNVINKLLHKQNNTKSKANQGLGYHQK